MLVTNLFFLGLVTFPICIWAWWSNCRFAALDPPADWRLAWRWSFVAGIAFAIAATFVWYPVQGGSNRYRVYGVPFMAYAFDQNGWDYVSCLTGPALGLNFAFWSFIPQLYLWLWTLQVTQKPDAP